MTKTTTIRLTDAVRNRLEAEAKASKDSMTNIIENALCVHYGMNEFGLASRVARLEEKLEAHIAKQFKANMQ